MRPAPPHHYLLFQKRSANKRDFPNLYDISAAGHILAGEDWLSGVREISEELGLEVDPQDLVFLSIRKSVSPLVGGMNREFCYTCLLESTRPLSQYCLQADELTGLIEVELSAGLQLINGEVNQIVTEGFFPDSSGIGELRTVVLTRDQLLPHPDAYYRWIFQSVGAYCSVI
ncbi:MAG: NUDIX domain-containing protein [Bacteroidia bacterium]|nr:NUDIX domain-containing protein [Bacteroidia bacterium]